MASPVLFLVFNRPDTTIQVFEAVRHAKPTKLYIAADGPRPNKEGEAEKCQKVREIVAKIDWDCEVKTLFRDKNLGSGIAVSQAISWFFENEEQGIILEDDCLPSPDFFRYCSELLELYKYNENIMHIGGTAVLTKNGKFGDSDYYFSNYPAIWGWATWRRAWKNYDITLRNYQKDLINVERRIKNNRDIEFWLAVFKKSFRLQPRDFWDYQWAFNIWKGDGFCIIPNFNLITNIGFGQDATHTNTENKLSYLKHQEIKFPLNHPAELKINIEADDIIADIFVKQHFTLSQRISNKIQKILKFLS